MCTLLPLDILMILLLKVQIYQLSKRELVTIARKVTEKAANTDPKP